MRRIRVLGSTAGVLSLVGCFAGDAVRPDRAETLRGQWLTHAERTDHAETARYDEVVAYCRRLAAASPHARYTTFGVSGEGRPLPLLILSRDGAFTPEAARRRGCTVVLVQNCIHPGECEGKDASLALAREMVITRAQADLLDHVVLLVMPIFNVDGHERFGPYHRINQTGPAEMGWRVTATNLNLNRDYTKADAVEMRAWLRLWHTWQPDLFIDNHTTNGSDHRYDVFYAATTTPPTAEPVAAWTRDVLLPGVLEPLAAAGYATLLYCWPRNESDLSAGLQAVGPFGARYSTGYASLCNRPALLVETHSLKPYGRRVQATYDLLVAALRTVRRDADGLRRAIQTADREAVARRGADPDGHVPLRIGPHDTPRRIVYRGCEVRRRASEITGGEIIEYTGTPVDVEADLYDQTRVELAVPPPAAYLVPPQWTDVIDRLALHGVQSFRLTESRTLEVEVDHFSQVTFDQRPYEGRQVPHYQVERRIERQTFGPGTVVVPLDQPRARLIAHLLEAEAPDSLAAWGFFNAVFEQKEYFEAFIMEPIARRMLAEDAALRAEFERKLAAEAEFAGNPGRRLDFFYRRSPWWDARHNVYPVMRWPDGESLRTLRGDRAARERRQRIDDDGGAR